MTAVVRVRGLEKRFGSFRALDGLDLEVDRGEVHGFLGPNGAGKSTTIRVLLGLYRPTGGSVSLFGRRPWEDPAGLHRRLAYVPGDVHLWPSLTGGQAIDLLIRLRGGDVAGSDRERLIEAFEFDPSKRIRTLSKGNRQKVALIAAFALPVELYILDEPTSGLDPLMARRFQAEVARVAREGASVLLSSHILAEVEELADRLSIIRQGRRMETGTLAELRHLTRSAYEIPEILDAGARARLEAIAHDVVEWEGADTLRGRARCHRRGAGPARRGGHRGARRAAAVAGGALPAPLRRCARRRRASRVTGAVLLTRAALRRDRGRLLVWAIGLLAFAAVCSGHVTSGFDEEALRAASLRAAIDTPALLVGRGLPMGTSHGAFLFYTYGVLLANAFALFAVLFTIRHGRAEEEDGSRELLRAAAIGRLAALAAALAAGAAGVLLLAVAMAAGLVLGGAEPGGALRAGMVCGLVGAVFLPLGALAGQIAPTARVAAALAFAAIIGLFAVRVVADLQAEVDPDTLIGAPAASAWLSPFSLAGLADPFGALAPGPLAVLVAASSAGAAVALAVELRREFGGSLLRPRRGPTHAPAGLRGPLRIGLRLQRSALLAMAAAGAVVGVFVALMAGSAIDAERAPGLETAIRDVVGGGGPLYDLLLGYVMVLVGECAAVAGVLALLHARREEVVGNAELVRGAAVGPVRWLVSALLAGVLAILLSLASSALGSAAVYVLQGRSGGAVAEVLGATAAQLPAALLFLGIIALVFAALPRFTGGIAWAVLALGVVLAELGGRLGLPAWVLSLSPFLHSPLVTMPDPRWSGAVWMTGAALAAAAGAVAIHRRRDLDP